MIRELFAVAAAYGFGWAYLRRLIPITGPAVAAAAAFPIGVALWSIVAALVIVSGVPYSAALAFWLCLAGVVVAKLFRGPRSSRRENGIMAAGLAAILAAGAVFFYFDATLVSSDAMFVLSVGKQIAQHGGITASMKGVLASFAIFLSLTHTAAVDLGLEYFRSLLPLFMASTLVLFVVFAIRANRRPDGRLTVAAILIPVLGAAFLASSYAFLWHGFFIKTAPVYSCLLLLTCAATFFAARESAAGWLLIAVPALLATMLLRMEAALTVLPALVVLMSVQAIPRRARLMTIVPVSAAFSLWGAFLVVKSFAYGMFSVYELTFMGALPGAFAAIILLLTWLHDSREAAWADRLIVNMPWIMCGFLAVFAVAYIALRPDMAARPLAAFYCYLSRPINGAFYFWAATAILLAAMPLVTERIEGEKIFVANAAGFLLVLLAITLVTPWKHCGPMDSGNRILTQIMPVVMFWLVLRYSRKRA